MSNPYKIGDLVVLKSGGPVMTVEHANTADGKIWCQWFSGKKLEDGRFPVGSIKYAEKDEK